MYVVFSNFPTVKKGVAQKTKFSISDRASSFRSVSWELLECPGSGIRFITITPILSQKSTSYGWPNLNFKKCNTILTSGGSRAMYFFSSIMITEPYCHNFLVPNSSGTSSIVCVVVYKV